MGDFTDVRVIIGEFTTRTTEKRKKYLKKKHENVYWVV